MPFEVAENPFMSRYVLIVGISDYNRVGLKNLSAPINDASAIYDVLHRYGNINVPDFLPKPTTAASERFDPNGFVSKKVLLQGLNILLSPDKPQEDDLAIFYFSGHGVNEEGKGVHLATSDERFAVNLGWLVNRVRQSPVKNVCIWLDCCHSGEVLSFGDLENKGYCIVAASSSVGVARSLNGRSVLTELLCEALTPDAIERHSIDALNFVQYIEIHSKNKPQHIVPWSGAAAFTLTKYDWGIADKPRYDPDKFPPYKGLEAFQFTAEDADFFSGRDDMVSTLRDKVNANRFVPLLGASGSGKSSLVLAGLLPKLPKSDWQALIMRPTAAPLESMKRALECAFPDTPMGELATGTDLHREVSRLVTTGKRLLLVIDQFEEVFTECHDDKARTDFFACLLDALDNNNPLHVVLTLRADFMGHCADYPDFGKRLHDHTVLLTAPHASELRVAIVRPLSRVGMTMEGKLVDELITQSLQEKGSLPLLQYVLYKLWEAVRQRGSLHIAWTDYQQLNGEKGLGGILNQKADAFYEELDDQQQHLMEWLMVELTQVGDGQDDTRHTVTLAELHERLRNRQPQYKEALEKLLKSLTEKERLLTQDKDNKDQPTITVAHEALIRDWQRLRGWLESNRKIKRWRDRLKDDIADWGKIGGGFLRDGRLAEAKRMLDDYPQSLLIGEDVRDFIKKSSEQQQNEVQKKQRQSRNILIASSTASFIFLILGSIASWKWNETERQKQFIVSGKLVSQSEHAIRSPSFENGYTDQGLLLAVQALHLTKKHSNAQNTLNKGLQMIGHLKKVLYGNKIGVGIVTFSPDGKHVVSRTNNVVNRWDVATGIFIETPDLSIETMHDSRPVPTLANGSQIIANKIIPPTITATALSPDGKYVINAVDDNTLRDLAP